MPLTGPDSGYVDIIPVQLEFSASVFEVWICPKVFGDSGGGVGPLLVRDEQHGGYSGKCPLEGPGAKKEELFHLNQVSLLRVTSHSSSIWLFLLVSKILLQRPCPVSAAPEKSRQEQLGVSPYLRSGLKGGHSEPKTNLVVVAQWTHITC